MNLRTALEDYDKADDVLFECRKRLARIFNPIIQMMGFTGTSFTAAHTSGNELVIEFEWMERRLDL